MKKSHEYDSPVLSRLVSVVTILAICICSICTIVTASKVSTLTTASGPVASNDGNQTVNNPTNNNPGTQTPNSGQNTPDTPANGDNNTPNTPDDSQGSDAPADSNAPSKEEILAKYNEVVQKLKDNVSEYHKKEWQRMDDDYDMGSVGNLVMPIANSLMTSEDKAEDQVRNDSVQIPVIKNAKATLPPLSADNIKNATMTESGGKTTIVIVLNDEKDCMPAEENAASAPSFHGAMFNPISKSGIDDIIEKFKSIANINNFTLTYNNCTATLVFDTESLKVDSLEQIMNIKIDVDAKVKFPPISIAGYATIINTMQVTQITYK